MSIGPFDFVKDIAYEKTNLIKSSDDPDRAEADYAPYVINKALSYYIDMVLYANEMNIHWDLDNRLQHDFLLNTIRKAKRPYAEWFKKEKGLTDLELVKNAYGFNSKKAESAMAILSEEQLRILRKKQE